MTRLRQQRGMTLVELLVSMVIAGIISSMMLISWFALNNSFSFSVSSSKARDMGREAMSRMEREVRDAQWGAVNTGIPPYTFILTSEPMVVYARPYTLVFSTTFNEANAANPTTKPHLVAYRLYYVAADDRAELWRFEDTNYDGKIAGLSFTTATDEPTSNSRPNFNLNERTSGEGGSALIKDVVNTDSAVNPPVPLFTYSGYFDSSGSVVWTSDLRLKTYRAAIVAVRIHLLVDLNPRHAPVFADLMNTIELRNNRVF